MREEEGDEFLAFFFRLHGKQSCAASVVAGEERVADEKSGKKRE